MKKILLGSIIALAVLTGCTEEKAAAPVATETAKEAAAPAATTPATEATTPAPEAAAPATTEAK